LEIQADQSTFKGYLTFFSGQQISLLGSTIAQFVVIWWITLETKSALYLSIASVVGFAPMIILTPFAGVLVDRWNRKALIGVVDFLQALSTLVLIYFYWAGSASIWHVLAILAFRSVCQAFHAPTVTAIVPLMVPRDHLSRMNSLNYLLTGVATLAGPVVAGFLLTFLRTEQILWTDPITFLVALLTLLPMKIPSIRSERAHTSFGRDLAEGLNFIKNARGLTSLIMLATALNFLYMPAATLMPYYVKFDHLGNASDFALVAATAQAGMLGGGIFMLAFREFRRKTLAIVVSILVSFLGYALMGFTPLGVFWFMATAALILDFGVAPANVSIRTILQTAIPADMQGRVNAVLTSLASAASPFGMMLSGVLVGYTGTANLFLGCAATGTVILLVSWFFTDLKDVEKMSEGKDALLKKEG
jgi:DHA3 family macrolide efflux protein-like MFS transporter